MKIHLGFEVGTGNSVEIPLKHTVITGQTQEAGKTTALEALIARSGLRALTFITKRGEGSFRNARRAEPYFREQADWQFVAAILEASRGEKLKFERAWIIRASKGARTLADVQRNVRKAMETAKGMSADVYLTLDAYLEAVVPQIAAVKWSNSVSLSPGVNVMDLTALNVEMQHLVIKSSLDWVLNHEENTVIVVPEAWKFIPQGRGTPVKLSAEAYIRQAAGLGNYLWLDSQDIAGVEKIILKSVPVWVLGVQREANEIKRTLDNIPAGIKRPKAADVSQLEIGQFFACWSNQIIKTYVQPEWMGDAQASSIAVGKSPIPARPQEMPDATEQQLKLQIPPIPKTEDGIFATLELEPEREPDMPPNFERFENKLDALLEALNQALNQKVDELPMRRSPTALIPLPSGLPADEEALYQRFKSRLISEIPTLFQVSAEQSEIQVTFTRPVFEVDGKTLRGRLLLLIADKFFDTAATGSAAYSELKRQGFKCAKPGVYKELDKLAEQGAVTKEADGYLRASGLKITRKEK